MELPRRRMYGCEEEDAMTLFRPGAGRSMSSMYHHDIAAGEQADDVLNLYGNGTATEHQHLCRHEHQEPRSSSRRSNVVDDVATDDDEEIEQAVLLRQRRQKQQQQQGVADDAAATDAVLVARDNQEVARQNAEAAERSAEAAREHTEVAMASTAHRDNNATTTTAAKAAAAARAHAEIDHLSHLVAEGVAEVSRLRAEVARRSDEAAAGIVMSIAAALLAPFIMAALLYYIFPLK